MIRMANHSEHGWGVVDENTMDVSARDSDDERRIEKVERVVEKAAAKHRKKCNHPAAGKPRVGLARFPTALPQPPMMAYVGCGRPV